MTKSTLKNLSGFAYDNSAAHGFWDDMPFDQEGAIDPQDCAIYYGNKLMLIVGEASEAHEELRKNTDPKRTYYREQDQKPEGLPFELADVLIRVFDLAGHLGLDLDRLVEEKMEYNASRPVRHGKNF